MLPQRHARHAALRCRSRRRLRRRHFSLVSRRLRRLMLRRWLSPPDAAHAAAMMLLRCRARVCRRRYAALPIFASMAQRHATLALLPLTHCYAA